MGAIEKTVASSLDAAGSLDAEDRAVFAERDADRAVATSSEADEGCPIPRPFVSRVAEVGTAV